MRLNTITITQKEIEISEESNARHPRIYYAKLDDIRFDLDITTELRIKIDRFTARIGYKMSLVERSELSDTLKRYINAAKSNFV